MSRDRSHVGGPKGERADRSQEQHRPAEPRDRQGSQDRHGHKHERPGHKGPKHERHGHHPAPYSTVDAFIDPEAIERLLVPWVPVAADRAFVVRCMTDEGPVHHRGSSFVLLSLLGRALEAAGGAPADVVEGPQAPVPLRLPPHLAEHSKGDPNYPLTMPMSSLEQLAGGDRASAAAMADCLADGPSHHALANAAMLCLIDALLRRLRGGGA